MSMEVNINGVWREVKTGSEAAASNVKILTSYKDFSTQTGSSSYVINYDGILFVKSSAASEYSVAGFYAKGDTSFVYDYTKSYVFMAVVE